MPEDDAAAGRARRRCATRTGSQSARPNRRSRRRERGERGPQVVGAEVGPERVGEDELGVGRLPEHEVRDPELAGGADQQVDLGAARARRGAPRAPPRRRSSAARPSSTQPPRRLDELGPAAVVERDPEVERVEVLPSPPRASAIFACEHGSERGRGVRRSASARPARRGRAARARSSRRGSPSASATSSAGRDQFSVEKA